MADVSRADEWDAEEDDDLPPREETRTAEGLKKVVEYSVSADGYLKKTTTLSKTQKITEEVSKGVAERRKWKRFGACAGLASGLERGISDVSTEEIMIEWIATKDEEEEDEEDLKAQAAARARKEMGMLRLQQRTKERNSGMELSSLTGSDSQPANWAQLMSMKAANATGVDAPATDKWISPSVQSRMAAAGTDPSGGYQRDDSATVRVSNVSANTQEQDLQELFRPFGPIRRIYLSRDRVTRESKGFAYVAFHNISDAQECINKLNGHPYDHLILQIEWAKPSEQRNSVAGQTPVYTRA